MPNLNNKKSNYIEEVVYEGNLTQNFTFNNVYTSDSSDSSDSDWENEPPKAEVKQGNQNVNVFAKYNIATGQLTVFGNNNFYVNGKKVVETPKPSGSVHVDKGIVIGEFSNGESNKQSIVIGKSYGAHHATHFQPAPKQTNVIEKEQDKENCKVCTIS